MDLGPSPIHITGPKLPSSWGLGSSLHRPPDHNLFALSIQHSACTLTSLPICDSLSLSFVFVFIFINDPLPFADQAPCYLFLSLHATARTNSLRCSYMAPLAPSLITLPLVP